MKKIILTTITACALVASAFASTVTFQGQTAQLTAAQAKIGQNVPKMTLVAPNWRNVTVGGTSSQTQVIATVLSLNTPVCTKETTYLNRLAKKYPNVRFVVVSKDLPFELSRFARSKGIRYIQLASNFRDATFAKYFGVAIASTQWQNLNARAFFVVNTSGDLIYKQVVNEVTKQPNYQALISALKKA